MGKFEVGLHMVLILYHGWGEKKTFLAKSVVFKNHTICIESTEKIFLSIQRTPSADKPWDSSVTFDTCFIESYCSINSSRWELPRSNICKLLWLKPLLNELVFHGMNLILMTIYYNNVEDLHIFSNQRSSGNFSKMGVFTTNLCMNKVRH